MRFLLPPAIAVNGEATAVGVQDDFRPRHNRPLLGDTKRAVLCILKYKYILIPSNKSRLSTLYDEHAPEVEYKMVSSSPCNESNITERFELFP
jgi:hypothetical protein